MYKFEQFDPRPIGAEKNSGIIATANDGRNLLGIEVTILPLAERCALGNLDHHGPSDTAETPSATEQAMTAELPSKGATLVTVRCDTDSVAAMAILASRFEGRDVSEEIVAAIGRFDRLGPAEGRPADAIIAIARQSSNFRLPLAERVAWVQSILDGTHDREEVANLVAARDAEFIAAAAASEVQLHAGARIASVVSTHRFATQLGYEAASVLVCFNPTMPRNFRDPSEGTYRKFTVCRYDTHTPCDLNSALAELRALESGWGGRGDIFGSPQGESSELSLEQVIEVVERHLT